MKEFCFLYYTNNNNDAAPQFFKSENSDKALKYAQKAWPWPFNTPGKKWWLMEVISDSDKR